MHGPGGAMLNKYTSSFCNSGQILLRVFCEEHILQVFVFFGVGCVTFSVMVSVACALHADRML